MRPYLAIIKDSFREALSSYVLWALIVVLSSILLLLAPFSYSEQLVGELAWEDVAEWRLMLLTIKGGAEADGPSPSKHIYSMFDADLRKKYDRLWDDLQRAEELEEEQQDKIARRIRQGCNALQQELDRLIKEEDIYDKKAWADFDLTDEAQELVTQDAGDLSKPRLRRRNRLLLEAAYPILVRETLGVEFRPTYMGNAIVQIPFFGAPASTTKEAVVDWYKGYIGVLMNWIVTLIIVFVGIIFTSAMIPRMFEPGSISLLLSKPVRRSYVFIARFLGGCAFMLLSAAYVVTGIFLIAGIRLGIWSPRVFICIPLFTFVFAVYFAVSAYIGAVWRSAIVSVIAVIVFFLLCLSIGSLKVYVADQLFDGKRVTTIIDAGETTLTINDFGEAFFWDDDATEWKGTFQRPRVFGVDIDKATVLYDAGNDRLLSTTVSYSGGPFSGSAVLAVGRDEDVWAMKEGVLLPFGTLDMFIEPDGHLLVVSPKGFHRLEGPALPEEELDPPAEDSVAEPEAASDAGDEEVADEDPGRAADPLDALWPGLFDAFAPAGPDKPLDVTGPVAVAMNPDNQRIAVYTGGVVAVYQPDEQGVYIRVEKKELAGSEQKAATLGFAGGTLVVGRDDGKVFVLDAKTLRQLHELAPEGEVPPRFIEASPGGKWFVVLFQNRELWLYDATEQKMKRAKIWSQGDISAVTFNSGSSILVADRIARVREMELPSMTVTRTLDPKELPGFGEDWLGLSTVTIFRWFVMPLYTILPRPGELGWTMHYAMTGEKTFTLDDQAAPQIGFGQDISSHQHAQFDPWTPVLSCGIFVAVMLALGCWYIERSEF